jgi:Ser/Thr protein kinase RdoA (MazF antagonist)
MKLTKKEAQKIADNYKLGKVKKVTYMSEGWVNWNYKLETDTGKYVVKIVGGNNSLTFRKKRMQEQANLLNHLAKNKFPYQIITPIKNKRGTHLMNFKKRSLWVYNYIEGDNNKKITKRNFQEIAKVLAIFHNHSKSFKASIDFRENFSWLKSEYKRLANIKPKNKLDKLFMENRKFLSDLLEKVSRVSYGKLQTTHRDFHGRNIIFKGEKITGIIDFDGIRKAPRVLDIAISILNTDYPKHGWNKKKQEIFLKAYEKISPLTKKEKKLIPILLIHHHILLFLWFYDGMEKNRSEAYKSMKWAIEDTKEFNEEWEKQK